MSVTRRDFIITSASIAGGAIIVAAGLDSFSGRASQPSASFAPPGELKVKYFGHFSELPVGSIKAHGWIKGWLDRQFLGITGHPENLGYPYDTCLYAGKIPPPRVPHGDDWWRYEQAGYFIDGALRLALVTDNPAAHSIPDASIAYILANSSPKKIGESTAPWPNTVIGRALMAQYSASANPAVARVLADYLLVKRSYPIRDGFLFEEALYLYGLSADPRLLEIATINYDRDFFNNGRSFSNIAKIRGAAPLREHGVTAAEQLKLLPLIYCYTGEAQALKLATLAYEKILDDSLMPDGGIVSSEALRDTAFDSLHETCDITDWSWSLGYMLMASGEGRWADLIERATFNALPGAVTKDFRQLQYFSSANQVLASSTACPRDAMTRMSYRAAHETECCSGNVNRAMPNYVTRMWMRSPDGLAATLYGPCELHTNVNGSPIQIIEETDYPFREVVTFTMKLAQPVKFTLSFRIPDWCEDAAIAINGVATTMTTPPGVFVTLNREFQDGEVITLDLPMPVKWDHWFGNRAVSLRRGPLVYSLKVAEKRVESFDEPPAIREVLKQNNVQGFPAVEFFPQSQWRYGIDRALARNMDQIHVIESPMPDNPFLAESAPVQISLPLRVISDWASDWEPVIDPPPEDLKHSPKNPTDLPTELQLRSAGVAQPMTLVPYGATHLRVTTLPVIET